MNINVYSLTIDRVDNGYYAHMDALGGGRTQYEVTRVFHTEGELTGWLMATLMGDRKQAQEKALLEEKLVSSEELRATFVPSSMPPVYQPTKKPNLLADIATAAAAPAGLVHRGTYPISTPDERDERGVWKTPPVFEQENN